VDQGEVLVVADILCFSLCSGKHEKKHQERNIKDTWDEAGMLEPT
jgi:hypothetical protein